MGLLCYFGARYGVEYFFSDKDSIPPEIRENPAFDKLSSGIQETEGKLNSAESMDEALKITEASMKPKLPVKIDEMTVLTNVEAGRGKTFAYTYMLTGVEISAFEKQLRPSLEADYNGPAMKAFKEGEVVVNYRYLDSDQNLIGEIVVGP